MSEHEDVADSPLPSDPAVETARPGKTKEAALLVRIICIIGVIVGGIGFASVLVSLKKPPAKVDVTAHSLSVKTEQVYPEDVPVTVSGLGEVRALNVVPLAPEVPGTIVSIHPRLEMGEIISEGDLLFRIDQRDYLAAVAQARAQVAQISKTIERLNGEYAIERSRLKTLDRSKSLMKNEFERVRDLFEKDDVGTRSAVDHAEMNLNQAVDARDQLGRVVTLYPTQIQEANSGLEGAEAQLALAEANLARTEVQASFDARVKQVNLEAGQYVTPGMQVLTLADDKLLEISVSVDSRDAKRWLEFGTEDNGVGSSWFGALEPLPCRVAWTEDPENHSWEGIVHRIENFDQRNRTVSLAVRISGEAATQGQGGLPLVEGMFCAVEIPGKTMTQVYRLPRWAVTHEGATYVVRDEMLAIQTVEVVRSEGDFTFVRGGLSSGEQVITTRLINPLPNTAVRVEEGEEQTS
jgi:RND family efflux transporter MFP subunit